MKRMILFLAAALLLLSACAAAPAETTREPQETGFGWSLHDRYREDGVEMEDFSDNPEYDYIKWSYSGWYHHDPTDEERAQGFRGDDWCSGWNLTMTARKEKNSSYTRSAMVIESMDDYNAILNLIAATKATALQNCGAYQEPEVVLQTWDGTIDEAFFDDYSIIMIDHCYEGHPFLRSRIDSITQEGRSTTVTLSWETVHAYTADQPGEVYWIIVPRPCLGVTVQYNETAWN